MEHVQTWQNFFEEDRGGNVRFPEYMAWDFPIDATDLLAPIRSKNKRKLLRKTEHLLQENAVRVQVTPLNTHEAFVALLDFFQQTHAEKHHEIGFLNPEWFENKHKQGRVVESLELFHDDTLIAMKLYSYDAAGFYLSHKASVRAWDERIDVGTLLDFLSFRRAAELGYAVVKTGKGRNFFGTGVGLQMSLLEYKSSLGLIARPAENTTWLQLTPKQNLDVFHAPPIAFFVEKPEGLCLQLIVPDTSEPHLQLARSLAPKNIPVVVQTYQEYFA